MAARIAGERFAQGTATATFGTAFEVDCCFRAVGHEFDFEGYIPSCKLVILVEAHHPTLYCEHFEPRMALIGLHHDEATNR